MKRLFFILIIIQLNAQSKKEVRQLKKQLRIEKKIEKQKSLIDEKIVYLKNPFWLEYSEANPSLGIIKFDPSFHKIINGGITNSERFIEKTNSKKVNSAESETTKTEPILMVSPKGSSSLKKEKPELIADPIDADGFYDMGNRFRNEKKIPRVFKGFFICYKLKS